MNFVEKDKKTVFKRRKHQGPLQVQKLFYPEENGACHVYLLHPPGGVVGGDNFDVRIDVGTNAKVLVTTPAAGKFYRSGGATAFQKQTIKVADHGVLEWFPSENIFFSGARARLDTIVNLSERSHFIGWDILCLGRPAIREHFLKGELNIVGVRPISQSYYLKYPKDLQEFVQVYFQLPKHLFWIHLI